jgi:hypothetical protein
MITNQKREKSGYRQILPAIVLCISAMLYAASPAGAHGPSEVILSYDQEERILSVSITHKVGDSSSHYINEVIVTKNGDRLESYRYKSQPDKITFTYTYTVEAEGGDVIDVTAACNRFGSKRASLALP